VVCTQMGMFNSQRVSLERRAQRPNADPLPSCKLTAGEKLETLNYHPALFTYSTQYRIVSLL